VVGSAVQGVPWEFRCIAVLDGVPAGEAVGYVRRHYHRRAVETPGQRRFVEES
jgi:hypothetical protein